ncbi:MAG: MFS transporter [Pseudomonadota bacterium]
MNSIKSLFHNRNFAGLILANTILGAAFPIQLVLGGLTGLALAPDPTLATLPSSVQTLAGMLAAAPLSLLMGRRGRRFGFACGAVLTLLGALCATQALATQNFMLLCAAHFSMGAGWASYQYFRFAAGEVVEDSWRPVAISLMLSSLLVAAIVGPQIFIATKDLMQPTAFAGAYAATGLIAALGVLPLIIVRIPRPQRKDSDRGKRQSWAFAALRSPAIKRAVGIAALAQGVMVFLMIPTPIAMVSNGLADTIASDVIRWHIVAMFAPSFFTGFLIKRFGANLIAMTGLATITVAAVGAATGVSPMHFYGSLIILGVGWNFGFIGATAMLDAAVSEADKAAVQGANDTVIALVSTIGAFAAGFVVSSYGWVVLALLSGAAVVCAMLVLWSDRTSSVKSN